MQFDVVTLFPPIFEAIKSVRADRQEVIFQAVLFVTGPAGLITLRDIQSSPIGSAPNPKDPRLSAEAKLHEYRRAKAKYDEAARLLRHAEKRAAEEDAKAKRAASRTASGAAKTAKAAASAKKARQVGNVARRKTRASK